MNKEQFFNKLEELDAYMQSLYDEEIEITAEDGMGYTYAKRVVEDGVITDTDEIAMLVANCMMSEENPWGQGYDDEVFEMAHCFKNSEEIFAKALEYYKQFFTPIRGTKKDEQEESLKKEDGKNIKESKLPVRGRKINEELKLYISLSSYKPWSGAVDTWDTICDAGKEDELEYILEDMYPEGLTETELNDILWFDGDEVLSWLGLAEEEEDEEDEDDYDESFNPKGQKVVRESKLTSLLEDDFEDKPIDELYNQLKQFESDSWEIYESRHLVGDYYNDIVIEFEFGMLACEPDEQETMDAMFEFLDNNCESYDPNTAIYTFKLSDGSECGVCIVSDGEAYNLDDFESEDYYSDFDLYGLYGEEPDVDEALIDEGAVYTYFVLDTENGENLGGYNDVERAKAKAHQYVNLGLAEGKVVVIKASSTGQLTPVEWVN